MTILLPILAFAVGLLLGAYVDGRIGARDRRELEVERDRLRQGNWRLQRQIAELERIAGVEPRRKEGLIVRDAEGECRVIDL